MGNEYANPAPAKEVQNIINKGEKKAVVLISKSSYYHCFNSFSTNCCNCSFKGSINYVTPPKIALAEE
ncbi:MAG TPA: hypothetical protein VF623_05160 [Segetibacter sp.]